MFWHFPNHISTRHVNKVNKVQVEEPRDCSALIQLAKGNYYNYITTVSGLHLATTAAKLSFRGSPRVY